MKIFYCGDNLQILGEHFADLSFGELNIRKAKADAQDNGSKQKGLFEE